MEIKRQVKPDRPEHSPWVAIPIILLFIIGASLIFVGIAGKEGSNTMLSRLRAAGGSGGGVIEGKDAAFYFALGLQYKDSGWVERARAALQKAAKLDPEGTAGHSAQVFLDIAIPKKFTSEEAIMGNIAAYNLMAASRNDAAVSKFREVIAQYPDFEWPYGNLASMYLDDGHFDEAEALVDKALAINPCYLNGLRTKIAILRRRRFQKEEVKYIGNALNCLGPRNRLEPSIAALYDEFAAMVPRNLRNERPQDR